MKMEHWGFIKMQNNSACLVAICSPPVLELFSTYLVVAKLTLLWPWLLSDVITGFLFFCNDPLLPYILGYKSRNLGQNLNLIFPIRLICETYMWVQKKDRDPKRTIFFFLTSILNTVFTSIFCMSRLFVCLFYNRYMITLESRCLLVLGWGVLYLRTLPNL